MHNVYLTATQNTSPDWGLIIGLSGLVLAVVGILATYVFYRRTFSGKRPVYSVRNNNLIQDYKAQLPDLQVLYGGAEVKQLSTAKVLFYNRGLQSIYRQDISEIDVIRIAPVPGVELRSVVLLKNNDEPNGLTSPIVAANGRAIIDFQYLDGNKGAVFQVVHTGTAATDIRVEGSGAGFKRVEHRLVETTTGIKVINGVLEFLVIVSFVIFTFVILAFILKFLSNGHHFNMKYLLNNLLILLFPLACGLIFLLLRVRTRRRPPKGLQVFDQ